jgi:DNA adenine methylase
MDTILRWAGSKRQLLGKLKTYWSGRHTRYVEPFCGSACLFFDLEPERALLGDLNSELITTYEVLKRDASVVCEYLHNFPKGKAAYYRVRAVNSEDLTDEEKAARFLYLNRHCFNGIYRTNRRGQFNVPCGTKTKSAGIDCEHVAAAASLLKKASFLNADFAITLASVTDGDFVYLDPPYAVSDRRIFSEYHPDTFTIHDLARLGVCLHEIDSRGATFVISYADSREARELLKPWKSQRVRARRHVAGFASHRRYAYELIATNS